MARMPVPDLVKKARFQSVLQLTKALFEKHPAFSLEGKGAGSEKSLEINLGNLFKGRELGWWRKRLHLAELVAQELKVTVSKLELDRDQVRHRFAFPAFPELPQLNLDREEPYRIGTPVLVTDDQSRPPSWKNLHYWLLGDGTISSPQYLDWLQVEDPTEFELIAAYLSATSRHKILAVRQALLADGVDTQVLAHHSPVILVVSEVVKPADLQRLRSRAKMAPLLVISPHASMAPESNASTHSGPAGRTADQISTWRWTLLHSWREVLVNWIADRLVGEKPSSQFDADSLIKWFDKVDPDYHWFPQVADVLAICSITTREPASTLHNIEENVGGAALFQRLFKISSAHLKHLEAAVLKRWTFWGTPWDVEVARELWIDANLPQKHLDGLLDAGILVQGPHGVGFRDRVLTRLLLRKIIDRQIQGDPPASWWPACFDQDRRSLVDGALGAMPMRKLESAAKRLSSDISGEEYLIGPAEALLVAIGRHLAKGKRFVGAVEIVGDLVLSRHPSNTTDLIPMSRPYYSLDQQFEWNSTLWIWSILRPQGSQSSNAWWTPPWSIDLTSQEMNWINPRASMSDGSRRVPLGRTLEYFMDVACRWSERLNLLPAGPIPLLLRPAILRKAVMENRAIDKYWWLGMVGEAWAEISVLRILDQVAKERQGEAMPHLWRSLVDWQAQGCKERNHVFTPGKDLLLPSCRTEDQTYSPVMGWVASRLLDEQVLDALNDEGRKFLESHPQWLITRHKLVVLRAMATQDGLKVPRWETWNFFSAYLPDAVDGLCLFLSHERLGDEAATGLWSWAPDLALSLLNSGAGQTYAAVGNLVFSCPPAHLHAAIDAVHERSELLTEKRRWKWVHYHLPNAGPLASRLIKLLPHG